MDKTYKYCAYYADLKLDYKFKLADLHKNSWKNENQELTPGQVYQAVFDVGSFQRGAKNVRIDIEFADEFKNEAKEENIKILPFLANVTSGDDFTLRNFYNGGSFYSKLYNEH